MARTRAAEEGFPIRVAAKITSIAPDTLRMWERRYGFPRPQRASGGSRLYTQADVDSLKLVTRALREGFRPGDVVGRSQAEIKQLLSAAGARAGDNPARPIAEPVNGSPVEAIVGALMADDAAALRAELRRAAALLGPRRFVTEVAGPVAHRVGALWEQGQIQIRQEHLLTDALSTQLRVLLAAHEERPDSMIVLLSTPAGELHSLGIEMVAAYLAICGAAPRLLGPDLPAAQIAEAARAHRADAVGLSVTLAAPVEAASRAVRDLLRALPRGVPLWLGGAGAARVAPRTERVRTIGTWAAIDEALQAAAGSS